MGSMLKKLAKLAETPAQQRKRKLKEDQWERLFIGKSPSSECMAMRDACYRSWEEIEQSAGVKPGEERAFLRRMREKWIKGDTTVPQVVFDTLATVQKVREYEFEVHKHNEEERTRGSSIYRRP